MSKRALADLSDRSHRLRALLEKYPSYADVQDSCADWVLKTLATYRPSSIGPDAPEDVRFRARMKFFREIESYVPEMFCNIKDWVAYSILRKFKFSNLTRRFDIFCEVRSREEQEEEEYQQFIEYILSDQPLEDFDAIQYFIPGGSRDYYPIVFAMMYINAAMNQRIPMYLYARESEEAIRILSVAHSRWPMQAPAFIAYHGRQQTFNNAFSRYTPLEIVLRDSSTRNPAECVSAHMRQCQTILSIIQQYLGPDNFPSEPVVLISQEHHNRVVKNKIASSLTDWLVLDVIGIVVEYYVSFYTDLNARHSCVNY